MNVKMPISNHKKDKINGIEKMILKLLFIIVIISAFTTIFINAPASDSFFTDRIESEPYSIEF